MIRAKASRSPQAKMLRGVIFRKTILYFLIFTGCFAGLAAWANAYLVPDLANYIADTTSSWTYYTPEQYDALSTLLLLTNWQCWMCTPPLQKIEPFSYNTRLDHLSHTEIAQNSLCASPVLYRHSDYFLLGTQ